MWWVLQHVCQVPVYSRMRCYMPGSSCFSSFNLHKTLFTDEETETWKRKWWSHEPENPRPGPGLSPVFNKCLKAAFPGEWIREGVVPNSLYPWWWFNKWYAVEMENKDLRKHSGKCRQGKCLWMSFWFGYELPGSQGKKWYGLIRMVPFIKVQRSSSLFQELCGKFQKRLIMEKETE